MNRALGATNIVDTVSNRPFLPDSWILMHHCLVEFMIWGRSLAKLNASLERTLSVLSAGSPINAMSDTLYRPDIVVYIMWLWLGHVSGTGYNRLRHCWLSWMSLIVLPKLDVDVMGFRNIIKMLVFILANSVLMKLIVILSAESFGVMLHFLT